MRTTLLAGLILCTLAGGASAQSQAVPGLNGSVTMAAANTFQLVLPANNRRRAVTIQNNNASDSCYVEDTGLVPAGASTSSSVTTPVQTSPAGVKSGGATVTAVQASILLTAALPYQRYYPFLPSGPIVVACASMGDSVFVSTQ